MTFTIQQWNDLSAHINYQLSAEPLNRLALLDYVLGRPTPKEFEEPLTEALDLVLIGYEGARRKLGPPAVLHPLRTVATIASAMPELKLLDLLGGILHDRKEDIHREEIGQQRWDSLQQRMRALNACIGEKEQWYLGERVEFLSRKPHQTYFEYLCQLVERAPTMPDLVRVKLADKLDSTYDITVPSSAFEQVDFHRALFKMLYVPTYRGLPGRRNLQLLGQTQATLLLSNISKNALFLTLMRRAGVHRNDQITVRLREALVAASIQQARWVLLEVLVSRVPDPDRQRFLIQDVLSYRNTGRLTAATKPGAGHRLDGTLLHFLLVTDDAVRKQRLKQLWQDPELYVEVVLSLIVIFSCFADDLDFAIEGIDDPAADCW